MQETIGSFHEIANRNYFHEDVELLPCDTFKELTESWQNTNPIMDALAIENSLVGNILHNYNLLRKNPVKIIGEEYLRIKQNLLALPGQTINDIREVHSHPMAIEQCKGFFNKTSIRFA